MISYLVSTTLLLSVAIGLHVYTARVRRTRPHGVGMQVNPLTTPRYFYESSLSNPCPHMQCGRISELVSGKVACIRLPCPQGHRTPPQSPNGLCSWKTAPRALRRSGLMSTAYRARAQAQLAKWAMGQPYHNLTDDECCPDFSCCHPELLEPDAEKRWAIYRKARDDQS